MTYQVSAYSVRELALTVADAAFEVRAEAEKREKAIAKKIEAAKAKLAKMLAEQKAINDVIEAANHALYS